LFKWRQWMLGALPRSYTDHSPSLCWVCLYIKLPSVTVHPFMAWCLAQELFYLYHEENSFQIFILNIACIELAVSNCKESGREWPDVLLDSAVCCKDYIALVVDEWNVRMEHWHMATDRGKWW
jgi:hypothetical protein